MGVDVRNALRRGWDEGGMQRIAEERREEGGETVRLRGDITLLAQRRRMRPLSGFRMRCAAVLTHELPDDVGGGCASSLPLQATEPRGNASLKYTLAKGKRGCSLPAKRLVLFQLPEWARDVRAIWVPCHPLGLLLETSGWGTTIRLDGALDVFFWTAMKTSQCRNETVLGISRQHSGGFVWFIQSLDSIFYTAAERFPNHTPYILDSLPSRQPLDSLHACTVWKFDLEKL